MEERSAQIGHLLPHEPTTTFIITVSSSSSTSLIKFKVTDHIVTTVHHIINSH